MQASETPPLRTKHFFQIADQLFYSLFRKVIEGRIGHAAGLVQAPL